MRFREFLEQPLLEGGMAIKGVSKISQSEVKQTVPGLIKLVANVLKLTENKVALIGSAGKKPEPSDLSGDLDLATECEASLVEDHLKELADGNLHKAMTGINVYSFGYPTGNKLVQVDLIPVQNLKFAEWSYQANEQDLKQGLKGAQRNELFFAIAKHMPIKVLLKDKSGEPVEVERYFYDLSQGLMTGVRSRQGKKDKLSKNFSTREKSVLTNDPVKVVKLMFGKDFSPAQVSTFGGTLEAIKSKDFLYHDQAEDILKLAKTGIKNKGLKVPVSI